MNQMRNVDADLWRFRTRVRVASTVVVVGLVLIFLRLFYLQVIRYDDLAEQAEDNRIAVVPTVPNRGLILDRNGLVLATNYSAYTLEVTPNKAGPLDPLMEALGEVLEINARDRKHFKKLAEEGKGFASVPIRTRLTDEEVARFTAQKFRFPGVEIKARLFRSYPYGELASHVIGYIGRINQKEKDAIEESDDDSNYEGTEYIGKLGIEQSFERQLHGITGVQEMETSAGGRAVRRLASRPATPGDTVVLALDIKLQKLVEDLFGKRRGALVAMDPKTGEVLAFVSKPTFDPNLFVEGIDLDNWQSLNQSIDKPLLNRALRGTYPPGSTYKPFMALGALELGKRSASTLINDPGYFNFGGHKFGSPEGYLGDMDMRRAIQLSSNIYFYSLANEMGVDAIHDFMAPLGFGQLTGIDIQGETRGVLPSTEWKRNTYKTAAQRKWYAGETISLGIGQGYNTFTMLQLAQATSVLATNGLKFKPHIAMATRDAVSRQTRALYTESPQNLNLKPENVAVIRDALGAVVTAGTSARAFAGAAYASGGKTGTAQAVTLGEGQKYDRARMGERQRDHALYVAMAPLDDPQIVLALIVENAGWGAEVAAPIARRVFDYWLQGLYPSDDDIAAVSLGQAAAPIGKARKASEMPWPPMAPQAP